ncbi:MAG: endolytic transglycosylase MltG [Patescibacteria group bacterium]
MQVTNPKRFLAFVIVVLLVVVIGTWALLNATKLKKSGEFSLPEGASARAVWQKLVDEEFTNSVFLWRYHAWRMSAEEELKAGSYVLEAREKVKDVIGRFVAGDVNPDELTITYPEGFTLEQIAERTSARGIGGKQEFLSTAIPQEYVAEYPYLGEIPANRNLEGYLFPDTYRIFMDDTPDDAIRRMLANFDEKIKGAAPAEALAKAGRSRDQIGIMASIIEREVLTDEDMTVVSGILWKRNDDGVGLDADATIRYALNKWDGRLTVQDLATDSPYNTRRWKGLPPGPISNPGLRALIAAVNPEESEYYYYLSTPEGKTIFSKTLDEHNANKAKYLQ